MTVIIIMMLMSAVINFGGGSRSNKRIRTKRFQARVSRGGSNNDQIRYQGGRKKISNKRRAFILTNETGGKPREKRQKPQK